MKVLTKQKDIKTQLLETRKKIISVIEFQSQMEPEVIKFKNLMHLLPSGKQNLKSKTQSSFEYLIYRKVIMLEFS